MGVPLPASYYPAPTKPKSWLDNREGQRLWYFLESWTKAILMLLVGIMLGISLVYGRK